ncbi:ABC transporter permease [Halosimplex litoreum]|uniref:ABC transporter permease n=1 Tax=Halosimplex litoreum TaxID=1198301 RepID=A0A7U3WAW2_9EURY|nr:ABC transporter permease [Halosimplex litoreum]QPV64757.1 ABC transporter permease [Halosimplex litoreum]
MDRTETLRISVRSLRSHRLRAALTVIGIVIGIAAVVTFATFGASLRADVVSEIEGSSANEVYLVATEADEGGGFGGAGQPVFTEYDLSQLREIEGVQRVVPRGIVPVSAVAHDNETIAQRQVTATNATAFETATFESGRAFDNGANEAVVNRPAAQLFPGNLSTGDELSITRSSGERFDVTVVGIVNGTGGQLPFSSFTDQPRVFVPADPFYQSVVESPNAVSNQRVYSQVTVVTDPADTTATQERVREYFAGNRSDAAQLVPDGYEVSARTNADLVDSIERIVTRLTRFVTGIAVIALIVGAVGIANIMLVSVTERTREIGIMKAVGARSRDVMELFLAEAVLLGALGAIIGVPLGIAAGWAATRYAEIPLTLAPGWFAAAVAVGVLTGVVAGLYPAWRAARVDPIDALRYE